MKKERPVTGAELLINERIMGGCNHPGHTTETERDGRFEHRYLICTKCGTKYGDYEDAREEKRPRDYLRKFVPPYSADVVLARTVARRLEASGWKPFMRIENGKYRYSFSKDSITIEGELTESEEDAICSAAATLAKRTMQKLP